MSSSLLLSLSSKPSLRKLSLRCQTLRTFSSSSTTTNPYLLYRVTCCGEKGDEESPGVMTQLHTFDPAKEEHIIVGDKPFPKELVGSSLVGSSNGWGVFLWGRRSILISDFCNPLSFKSKPKFIPLLPRPDIISCQADLVSGVAMSSSPQVEEDYLVAVKFTGRPVSIYKPSDTKAVHLTLPHNVFDHFEPSKLMYSKRDQRFYMPSSGGHHLWSWDGLESTEPEFHELRFHNLPQFSHSELQLLDSCHRKQHFVESPSGQRFLVKWYVQCIKALGFNCGGTKRFMVFREEEDMNMCYTEDIGDLCIFLGDNEPFCVKASLFPGLNPNSIYFVGEGYGEGYGVYNIATRTPRSFKPKPTTSDSPSGQGFMLPLWAPHWLPPFPL
ncbi:hypothetical protein Bca101_018202 [Brassica carinata]